MKHRNSHFAVGYWSRIRGNRATPDQADIDPKALKRLLPIVFLLEARGDGGFIYRLAGTTLCDRLGGELRGRNYLNQWDADSSTRVARLLRQALAARIPVCLNSVGATMNCAMVEIETVLMPVGFGSDEPERFLGMAQILTDVAPLAGEPIAFERLVSGTLVREEETAMPAVAAAAPAAPAARIPLEHPVHPRAPHLRLVSSRNPDADYVRRRASAVEEMLNAKPAFGRRRTDLIDK